MNVEFLSQSSLLACYFQYAYFLLQCCVCVCPEDQTKAASQLFEQDLSLSFTSYLLQPITLLGGGLCKRVIGEHNLQRYFTVKKSHTLTPCTNKCSSVEYLRNETVEEGGRTPPPCSPDFRPRHCTGLSPPQKFYYSIVGLLDPR